jgi:hypothetical protein
MTVDEAIRGLLNVSTDVHRVALLGADGRLLGAGPDAVGADVVAAAERLWEAASRRAVAMGEAPLDHVVVRDPAGGVAVVREGDRRIAALTSADPALGLLLFDLRTCLADAHGEEETP